MKGQILHKTMYILDAISSVLSPECTKIVGGCGFAPDPAGEFTALIHLLAGFKGPTPTLWLLLLRVRGEGKGEGSGEREPKMIYAPGPETLAQPLKLIFVPIYHFSNKTCSCRS